MDPARLAGKLEPPLDFKSIARPLTAFLASGLLAVELPDFQRCPHAPDIHLEKNMIEARHESVRIGIDEEIHIGFMDLLKSPDGGSVKADPVHPDPLAGILSQFLYRDGEVLPESGEVIEFQIDDMDVVFPDDFKYLLNGPSIGLCRGRFRSCRCVRKPVSIRQQPPPTEVLRVPSSIDPSQ